LKSVTISPLTFTSFTDLLEGTGRLRIPIKEGGRSNPAARRTEGRVFVAAMAYEGHGYLIFWRVQRES